MKTILKTIQLTLQWLSIISFILFLVWIQEGFATMLEHGFVFFVLGGVFIALDSKKV